MSVLNLFHENTVNLHRDGTNHFAQDSFKPRKHFSDRSGRLKHRSMSRLANPFAAETDFLLPDMLSGFASDLHSFLQCINEFPELVDDHLNESMINLEGDLQYWSSFFGLYKGQDPLF